MSNEINLFDYEYVGEHPYPENPDKVDKVAINSNGARFVLHRTKKRKSYDVAYDLEWSEVVSFECCEVNIGKDDKSWPLNEKAPKNLDIVGQAGMLFIFLKPTESNFFQIWTYIPREDVTHIRETIEEYVGRPNLTGLAHHGNAAPVKYILDYCNILERHTTTWHDWIKTGPLLGKPREKKWKEKGPDYVFCEEGVAIDFYGAGEGLEQMSTFWPWRLIADVVIDDYQILYQWYDDDYTFRQQVWDKEERKIILDKAKNALSAYRNSDSVEELISIRPWSFPSYFHATWDKLQPFLSKASRNGFPPHHDFIEE